MCDKCESRHEKLKVETPCETCFVDEKRSELDKDNYLTLQIWELVMNQIIVAPMGGAVDISIPAVLETMKLFNIEDGSKLLVLKNIIGCWRYFNNKAKKEQEKQDKIDRLKRQR